MKLSIALTVAAVLSTTMLSAQTRYPPEQSELEPFEHDYDIRQCNCSVNDREMGPMCDNPCNPGCSMQAAGPATQSCETTCSQNGYGPPVSEPCQGSNPFGL